MKNILVTIDFKNDEKLVIDKAFQFGEAFNAKVWLLHIADPDPDFVGFEIGPQYIRDSKAEDLRKEHKAIQAYAAELKEKGVDAEGLLVQGATIEMIMEEAKKLQADLIITGHHEHSFIYKAFAECVSAEIIKKSKIPVLIVPLE